MRFMQKGRKKIIVAIVLACALVVGFLTDAVSSTIALAQNNSYTVSFLGDSITYGWKSDKSYAEMLANKLEADTYNNYGIVGSTISTGGDSDTTNPMVTRYTDIDSDSDLIVVFGGTNDWYHNVELGSLGDIDTDTFYGALQTLMSSLQEDYPDATIVFVTPIKRIRDGASDMENSNGNTLEEFAEAVCEVAEANGISVIDLYHNENTDFTSDTSYTLFWSDGLHPNVFGDSIIANEIYKYLEEKNLITG